MGCLSLHTFSLGSSKAEQYFYFCLIILEATELPAGCQGSVMTAALTSTEHLGQFISLVIPRYSSSPPTFQSARPPPFLTSQQVIKRPRKHAEWKQFCHSSLTHTHISFSNVETCLMPTIYTGTFHSSWASRGLSWWS